MSSKRRLLSYFSTFGFAPVSQKQALSYAIGWCWDGYSDDLPSERSSLAREDSFSNKGRSDSGAVASVAWTV